MPLEKHQVWGFSNGIVKVVEEIVSFYRKLLKVVFGKKVMIKDWGDSDEDF
jgi:hypothetical protein